MLLPSWRIFQRRCCCPCLRSCIVCCNFPSYLSFALTIKFQLSKAHQQVSSTRTRLSSNQEVARNNGIPHRERL